MAGSRTSGGQVAEKRSRRGFAVDEGRNSAWLLRGLTASGEFLCPARTPYLANVRVGDDPPEAQLGHRTVALEPATERGCQVVGRA